MKNIYFSIAILLFSSCTHSSHQYLIKSYNIIDAKELTPYELRYIINTLQLKNYMLIDLRNPNNFYQSHIENAISIPYKNLAAFLSNTPTITKTFIFYDHKQVKRKKIGNLMKKHKITNYTFLKGGFSTWQTLKK